MHSLLGSGGLANSSGDLDLNIDEDIYNYDIVLMELLLHFDGDMIVDRRGNKQIFVAVPIAGDERLGYVQVDLMFGNYAWQQFSYHSPGNRSKYKGLYRTELVKALTTFRSNNTYEEEGQIVARYGPTFFHDRGLVWRFRHRAFKVRTPNERVKTFVEISQKSYERLYGTVTTSTYSDIVDPKEVMEFLLPGRSYEAFDSYESLVAEISKESNDAFGTIMKIYLERLNSLKVFIPGEIEHAIISAINGIGGTT